MFLKDRALMFSRHPVAVAVLALCAPFAVLAQTSSNAADEVVVTGSRFPESLATAVRPVQVITAQDIRQSGAATLADVLTRLGGVEASSSGGAGQPASVFIRGAESRHTVVLVDGVRIGSATLGAAPIESLPLALVERVEVLAGASSSLYGSDAVGGVIQVFTQRAGRTPQASLAMTAGDQGLWQWATTYARRIGDTDISLGANLLTTAGTNATTPSNIDNYNADRDAYRNQGFNVRVSQQLGGDHQVDAQWLRSDNQVHFDQYHAAGQVDPTNPYNSNRTQTLAVHWAGPLGGAVRSDLRVARAWDEARSQSDYPGFVNTQQDQVSWLNRLALGAGTLRAGLEWLSQSVSSNTAYARTSRDIASGLVGWQAGYGALSVQADLRHDSNSQFGGATTAQLGGVWHVDQGLRWHASVGNAFKAPTLNDLYFPNFFGTVGNPDLKPERSRSAELGVDARLGGAELGATVFANHVRDLIQWVETAPNSYAYEPQNLARAQTQGLTLTASTALGADGRARLSLTQQDPKDSASGYQLSRRAKRYGNLHLTHRLGQVQLGSDLNWVGERFDSTTQAAAQRMGGYGLVAVFASWQFRPEWRLEGRVNNLGDKAYTQAIGYATPGRQAQVTLRWTPAL